MIKNKFDQFLYELIKEGGEATNKRIAGLIGMTLANTNTYGQRLTDAGFITSKLIKTPDFKIGMNVPPLYRMWKIRPQQIENLKNRFKEEIEKEGISIQLGD